MSRLRNIVMAGALAFATAAPVVAEAAPLMNAPMKIEKSSDVTNVRCWRCRGWRGGPGWRGRYWGPRRVWVAPRRYWGPRVVIAPRVVYRGGWSHTNWCANRYRTYDARSNTFIAYGGYRKVCVSPY